MQKLRIIPIIALISLSITGCSGKTASSNSIIVTEGKVKEIVNQGLNGKNRSNISLTHRKLTLTEIASYLDLSKEDAKQYLEDSNTHGYFSLTVNSCPPEKEFTLYHIDMAGNVRPTNAFQSNSNGVLLTSLDRTWIDISNNFLFFSNYLSGEPVDFVLKSKDGKYFGWTRIVPNPIEYTDQYNRRVSVQISSKDKRRFMIDCSGFKPNKSYMLICSFEKEKLAYTLDTDQNGCGIVFVGPNNPYITEGEASLEIRGNEISKPLKIFFKWGT